MGAVRGKRVHLIGPLPSASWDVVLMGGGSHPWWFAVLGTGQTLWGQNAGKMEATEQLQLTVTLIPALVTDSEASVVVPA